MLHRLSTQVGQTEHDNGSLAPAVRQYFAAAGINLPADLTVCPYWGGALLAWAAIQDGIVPPVGAADPMAWLGWGAQLLEPVSGAIVILTEGAGRGAREVAIVGRVGGGKVYIIGVHMGAVQSRAVPLDRVIAARRPPGASLPVTMPLAEANVIRRQPDLPVTAAEPIASVPIAVSAPPLAPPSQIVKPGVSIEALQRLLDHVQDRFRRQDERIATVERTAIASVELKPVNGAHS